MYIHIPFCIKKCDYCAFYSFTPNSEQMDEYLDAVLKYIESYSNINFHTDTIYFGGGTPSLFGGERISRVINKCYECIDISENAEITVECNPSSVTEELAIKLTEAGVNRISMGVQSAVDSERKALGRLSDTDKVNSAISCFRKAGIKNISLDLMIGIPGQTMESLDKSLKYILSTGAEHISVYMLKVEEETPLFTKAESMNLPDEDETADMYLFTSAYLKSHGYNHYEISNFALPGYESRHNTKYWKCEEYIGIGPSAHSFLGGKRFFYPSNYNAFIAETKPVEDGTGGDEEEYIMLSLRLKEGLSDERFFKRYNTHIPERIFKKAEELKKHGLIEISNNTISLTPQGFLISNYIIGEFLNE